MCSVGDLRAVAGTGLETGVSRPEPERCRRIQLVRIRFFICNVCGGRGDAGSCLIEPVWRSDESTYRKPLTTVGQATQAQHIGSKTNPALGCLPGTYLKCRVGDRAPAGKGARLPCWLPSPRHRAASHTSRVTS